MDETLLFERDCTDEERPLTPTERLAAAAEAYKQVYVNIGVNIEDATKSLEVVRERFVTFGRSMGKAAAVTKFFNGDKVEGVSHAHFWADEQGNIRQMLAVDTGAPNNNRTILGVETVVSDAGTPWSKVTADPVADLQRSLRNIRDGWGKDSTGLPISDIVGPPPPKGPTRKQTCPKGHRLTKGGFCRKCSRS